MNLKRFVVALGLALSFVIAPATLHVFDTTIAAATIENLRDLPKVNGRPVLRP